MSYFKIGTKDYSLYVNSLKIKTSNRYNQQTNAIGNSVVDYINKKRIIEVGIIPLNDTVMADLLTDISAFNVKISFLNPQTKAIEENIDCIIPENEVEYYTIRVGNTSFKAFTLSIQEL